ncbi:MAG: DEAD/DEAH box helicase [Methanobrevibacter sp.]|jgi:Fanconi anemia group M protein|nr:DEAD/DEAH box helicase [Candidatus Methanovirga meridionalis]
MVEYIKHPLLIANTVESRIYQQVLAADVLKKGNTMIVAPTALGKTIIAVLLAADRLNKFKNSKILVLAPSKPLTIQHEESFRTFLSTSSTSITGAIKTDDRENRWDESQIICATPQTVESDLLNRRYSLKDISLVVFDECHHAVGSYAYVYLAARYMNEGKIPLILGLTASPGSDSEKIKSVCENLYIENIAIKTEEDLDVKPYFNPIEIDWIKVKMSKELNKIKEHLDKALTHRLKMLKNLGVISTISLGKKDILKVRGQVQNRIARMVAPPKECYRAISLITAVINIQHSLELLETQGINPVNKYFEKLRMKTTKAAKSLLADPDFNTAVRLTRQSIKHGWEHPKLKKLIDILKEELDIENNQINNPKIIVFTQFRDTLNMIYEKCEEEGINSVKFFGQGISNGEKGLSQKEQKQIIKSFRVGNHDVLISTSVAEEGIDIPSVDLVVLYEPVPSEIRMIQRRGRTGRKNQGKMKVLITEGTRDEGYYWSSHRKEKKMKTQLINVFKDINFDELKPVKSKIIERKDNDIKKILNEDNEKENSAKKNEVVVYADSRESNSKVLRALDTLSVEVQIRTMAVGDYQVSDDVAIERKTAKDFIDSIVDKRLYKQARLMKEEFKKPVIILEGDDFYSGFLNPNAIRGSMASIAIDFGIPIIPTRNHDDTAAMIKRIAIREQGDNERIEVQIRTEKKPINTWEQQLFIIESLPHIGPVTAKKLLEKFATVQNIINATEPQLQEVDGIGKKTAKDICSLLSKKYLYFKDENENKKLV